MLCALAPASASGQTSREGARCAAPVAVSRARRGRVTHPAPMGPRLARCRRWRLTCVYQSLTRGKLSSSCRLVNIARGSPSRKRACGPGSRRANSACSSGRKCYSGALHRRFLRFGSRAGRRSGRRLSRNHARRRSADASRDRKLRRLGFRIVRLDAELVLRDLNAAVALIRAALWRTTSTSPSRAHGFGGGRRRAARGAGEHRRVPAPHSVVLRGGSCGEGGFEPSSGVGDNFKPHATLHANAWKLGSK